MIIESKILRAAQLFQGKDDIRKELNGIKIIGNEVTGSDGHTAVIMKTKEDTGLCGVLYLPSKVPMTAHKSELSNGTIIHFDEKGKEKGRTAYEYVEQETFLFPVSEMIPSEFNIVPEPIVFQPLFMKRIGEAFPQPKKGRCITRLEHYEGGRSPIIFTVKTSEIESCEPVVLIMPVVE